MIDKSTDRLNGIKASRFPPHNDEAENGVIGSALQDNNTLDETATLIKSEDFWSGSRGLIWNVIVDMRGRGVGIDGITLCEEVKRLGLESEFGTEDDAVVYFVADLQNAVPHSANAKYYAQIVREKAVARHLIQAATVILNDAYSQNYTAAELQARAESGILAVWDGRETRRSEEFGVVLQRVLDRMENKHSAGITGLATGWRSIDDKTNGLLPGKVYLYAGRPSMGKSAAVQNVANHVAMMGAAPVLFVTLEVSPEDVATRILSINSGVSNYQIDQGWTFMSVESQNSILKHAPGLIMAPIRLHFDPDMTMLSIASEARRVKKDSGLSLIIIDYVQLLTPINPGREPRQEQVAKISRAIKNLAMELNVPVINVCQLNREPEKRPDKRPRLADLRESGALEADADVVILIHRPGYFDPSLDQTVAEFILAKNRDGETTVAKMAWEGSMFRLNEIGSTEYVQPSETDSF